MSNSYLQPSCQALRHACWLTGKRTPNQLPQVAVRLDKDIHLNWTSDLVPLQEGQPQHETLDAGCLHMVRATTTLMPVMLHLYVRCEQRMVFVTSCQLMQHMAMPYLKFSGMHYL